MTAILSTKIFKTNYDIKVLIYNFNLLYYNLINYILLALF